jgi:hypothetical protein
MKIMCGLPRVTPETRTLVSELFNGQDARTFVMDVINAMERDNPKLLDVASRFAVSQQNPWQASMSFALLYRLLSAQATSNSTQFS